MSAAAGPIDRMTADLINPAVAELAARAVPAIDAQVPFVGLEAALTQSLVPAALLASFPTPGAYLAHLTSLNAPPAVCGRVFAAGEPTYGCRTCRRDPTCVMCGECFRQSAHRQHDYVMHTSGGGGCCDCGDAEAWRAHPACSRHQRDPTAVVDVNAVVRRLPAPLLPHALDFVDALLSHIERVLYCPDSLALVGPWAPDAPAQALWGPASGVNCVLLYNDETHSFDEVIDVLLAAVPACTEAHARAIANTVDTRGRALVLQSQARKTADTCAAILGSIGLKAQVLDLRVLCHQQFAIASLQWLTACAATSDGLRRIICGSLLRAPQLLTQPAGHPALALALALDMVPGAPNNVVERFLCDFRVLWKDARVASRGIVLGALLLEPDFKRLLGFYFTRQYQRIFEESFADDQHESESMSTLAVQLYTVPSISRWLVADHRAFPLLTRTFSASLRSVTDADGRLVCDDEESSAILDTRAYASVLHDIQYILRCDVGSLVDHLDSFLGIFSLLQGIDMHVRQTVNHVEMEGRGWSRAICLAYHVGRCFTAHLVEGCTRSLPDTITAVHKVLRAIVGAPLYIPCQDTLAVLPAPAPPHTRCIVHDVLAQPATVHVPLQRLLVGLLLRATATGALLPSVLLQLPDWLPYDATGLVLALLDPCLRVLVLQAQVRANLWVRNGFTMQHIFHNYSLREFLGELMYDCDVAMTQIAATLLEPAHFISVVLERFAVAQWFSRPEADLVIHPATLVLLEDMFSVLIYTVAERYEEGVGDVALGAIVRREIIHQLLLEPLPYSDLQQRLSHRIVHHPNFDEILTSVATLRAGAGDQQGTSSYTLKPEVLPECDEFFYHYTPRLRTTACEILQNMRKGLYAPPPPPPPFRPSFAALSTFGQSDALLGLIHVVLARAAGGWNAATCAWGQTASPLVNERLVRQCLHLLAVAICDEKKCTAAGGAGGGSCTEFVRRLTHFALDGVPLCRVLLRLRAIEAWLSSAGAHRFAPQLDWLFEQIRGVEDLQLRSTLTELGFSFATAAQSVASAPDDLAARRAALANAAAERKTRVLRQFAAMQEAFVRTHAAELASIKAPRAAASGESASSPAGALTVETPPRAATTTAAAAAAAAATLSSLSSISATAAAAEVLTCINCQQESESCFVVLGFAQPSTNLPMGCDAPAAGSGADPHRLLLRGPLPHVSACGHVMHVDCWQRLVRARLQEAEMPRLFRSAFERPQNGELCCPLCSAVTNVALPLVQVANLPVSGLPTFGPAPSPMSMSLALADNLAAARAALMSATESANPGLGAGLAAASASDQDDEGADVERALAGTLQNVLLRAATLMLGNMHRLLPGPASSRSNHWFVYHTSTVPVGVASEGNIVPSLLAVLAQCQVQLQSLCDTTGSMWLGGGPSAPLAGADTGPVRPAMLANALAYTAACLEVGTRTLPSVAPHGTCLVLRALMTSLNAAMLLPDEANTFSGHLNELLLSGAVLRAAPLAVFVSGLPHMFKVGKPDTPRAWARCCLLLAQVHALVTSGRAGDGEGDGDDSGAEAALASPGLAALHRVLASLGLVPSLSEDPAVLARVCERAAALLLPFARTVVMLLQLGSDGLFFSKAPTSTAASLAQTPTNPDALARWLGLESLFCGESAALELRPWLVGWVGADKPALVSCPRLHMAMRTLIALPAEFSDLFDTALKVKCPTTLASCVSPALCLLCGEFVCAQSPCCQHTITRRTGKATVGACTSHAQHCGAGVGLFFVVKNCYVVLMHGDRGTAFVPPYVDSHGESDVNLKHGRPLTLHAAQYAQLQSLWLAHHIPLEIGHQLSLNSVINRKILGANLLSEHYWLTL